MRISIRWGATDFNNYEQSKKGWAHAVNKQAYAN